ncbi:MAG: diguanylate cyclase, partial [Lachnospiraceae bacterium]|nr:diguanylate cyclase [Lachnospiraceae bacterium]
FKDADHNRLVNTGSAYTVIQDVLEGGKDVFYEDVKINDEKYFAYYKPIVNSDGSVFGMYGVCRNSAKVNRGVYRAIIPIILIFAAAAVIVALATASEAGKTVGMLNVLNRFMEKVAKSDFEADLPHDVLTSDDEVGALAKTGKQMQNSLRKLVDYDALTEVYNRRYATGELKEIRENSNIDGTDFCVAIADIDFFKKVNDTYGHDAGDLVLKEVASVFKRNMGGHGFVARWGGEEFLFVFTTCVLRDAQDVLLKIMDDIRRLEISYGEHIISPRISAGLIQAQRDEEADKCVKRADDLLYYAKGHGRDRLVSEDDTEFIRLPENDENE